MWDDEVQCVLPLIFRIPLYRRLKSAAALRRCSIKDLVLRSMKAELQGHGVRRKKKPVKLSIIASKRPRSLRLTNRKINEILFR